MKPKRLAIGCLGLSAGAAAAFAWLLTIAGAMNFQPVVLSWAAAAVALSWVTWRFCRKLERTGPRWDTPIREAIAALPKGSRVRRSRAGQRAPAATLAYVVYFIGLVLALMAAIGGSGEGVPFALWTIAVAGFAAGVLLAVARDGRGRSIGIWTVLALPGFIGLWLMLESFDEAAQEGRGWELILSAVTLVLVIGLPVVIGFGLPRGLAWLYRSTRPARLATPSGAVLLPELEAATDHRRAFAVLRRYEADDDGRRYLAEDRRVLEGFGYRLLQVCETVADARNPWHAFRDSIRNGSEENVIAALFVRQAEART